MPGVAELYAREPYINEVIPYRAPRGARAFLAKWKASRELRERRFDLALLFPNSFDSAIAPWLAGIPRRIGYARDARRWLLTESIKPPSKGTIPRHESFYYLELLRRAGFLDKLPEGEVVIRLEGAGAARAAGLERIKELGLKMPVTGVSPGAAYGGAKRWLPERFAEAARHVAAHQGGSVALFGTGAEKALCEEVRGMLEGAGIETRNLAGATSLREFIELGAACRVFLTNDSGSMHIASALGVPTVAVFGATDDVATGPTGPLARVVRRPVDCAPCLLRECPIDHRCMTAVTAQEVALTAIDLTRR